MQLRFRQGNVTKVVLDPNVADIEIRRTVFRLMSRLDLETDGSKNASF